MHIPLIYKLASSSKTLEIENLSKWDKIPQPRKIYTNIEKILQKDVHGCAVIAEIVFWSSKVSLSSTTVLRRDHLLDNPANLKRWKQI